MYRFPEYFQVSSVFLRSASKNCFAITDRKLCHDMSRHVVDIDNLVLRFYWLMQWTNSGHHNNTFRAELNHSALALVIIVLSRNSTTHQYESNDCPIVCLERKYAVCHFCISRLAFVWLLNVSFLYLCLYRLYYKL